MEIKLELTQRVFLDQTLEDPDKAVVMKAMEFWEGKPHNTISIPMSEIKKVLAGKTRSSSNEWELQKYDGLVEIEFVRLTPAEMAELDKDEKIGKSVGNSIFICEETPDEYVPMVLLNLYSLVRVNDQSNFGQMLDEAGISLDEQAHWSATLFDIAMAESVFRDDPVKFARFLQWRKAVERTDFFKRIALDNLFNAAQARRTYRLTTHPSRRGKYARRSWALSGAMDQVDKTLTEDFRSFTITRADVIARRIVECPSFDADAMVELIGLLRKQNSSDSFEIPAGKLDNQAYLLTEDICGASFVLEQNAHQNNRYKMARQGVSTLNALSDRIVYFYRQAALKKGVSADMFRLVKNVGALELPVGGKAIEVDIADQVKLAESKKKIGDEIALIEEKLVQVEKVLADYQKIFDKLNANSSVSLAPGSLEANMKDFQKAKDLLLERKKSLEAVLESIDEIVRLKNSSNHLLNAAVLDFETPNPKQLVA